MGKCYNCKYLKHLKAPNSIGVCTLYWVTVIDSLYGCSKGKDGKYILRNFNIGNSALDAPRPERTIDMVEKHETFYSKEDALACQAQHAGAEIITREGHGMMLNGVWSYVLPEDRPSWTVYWEEEKLDRYFYTFSSDPGFPYQNGWVEIHAASRDEADRKFQMRFPDRPGHKGIMNYSFCYNEEQWAEMDPEHTWTGWKLHEIIE